MTLSRCGVREKQRGVTWGKTMVVENTNGEAQPAESTTQQNSAVAADEGVSALEQMVVAGDEPAAKQENAGEQTPAEEPKKPEAAADEVEADGDEGDDVEDESAGEDEDEGEEASEQPHKGQRAEKRIHKLTAQRNEAREKLTRAEAEAKAAREAAVANIALDPSYLNESQLAQIRSANKMIERKEFLMLHIGVGFEDEKNPSNSLTAKQVAEELVQLERYSGSIGEAQRFYNEAKQQQLEDMKAGRMLRLSKQALAKTKKPAPAVKTTPPSATATRSVAASPAPKRGQNAERFRKSGATEDAALRELEELIPG